MTKSRGILPPRRAWSAEEDAVIRELYAVTRTVEIADRLQRKAGAVHQRARKLGVAKAREFIVALARQRTAAPGHGSHATRFPKGAEPWNKGFHYEAGGRSAETRFKPGARPHTWKPVGSYRVNADGYLDQKVSDTGYPPRDWRAVHRLVWEAANGPVPAGRVVVFKPGRHTTDPTLISLDAVECITRQELMQRNTVHNLPKPLAELVQLRGAINRQINKRAKESA